MIIKIRNGSAVTELTTDKNNMWKIKQNNAGIEKDKLKAMVEVLGGRLDD